MRNSKPSAGIDCEEPATPSCSILNSPPSCPLSSRLKASGLRPAPAGRRLRTQGELQPELFPLLPSFRRALLALLLLLSPSFAFAFGFSVFALVAICDGQPQFEFFLPDLIFVCFGFGCLDNTLGSGVWAAAPTRGGKLGKTDQGGWGMTAHYQVTKFFLSHGDMVRGFGEFRRRSFSWVGLRWLASCNAACHVKSVMCRWLWPTTLLRANQQPQQLHSIQSSKQSLATAGSAQLDARPCTEQHTKRSFVQLLGRSKWETKSGIRGEVSQSFAFSCSARWRQETDKLELKFSLEPCCRSTRQVSCVRSDMKQKNRVGKDT